MPKKVIDYLQPDDLCDDMKFVAELCGFETAKILIEKMGGLTITIPKPVSMRKLVDRYLIENMPTKSTRHLALELNLNQRTITTRLHLVNNKLGEIGDQ